MSSGPPMLDARTYGYATFDHTVGPDETELNARGRWLITRITFWASGATNCRLSINYDNSQMPVAPNGCLELEPNGAYRAPVRVRGEGSRVLIEYWWLPQPDGLPPAISVIT